MYYYWLVHPILVHVLLLAGSPNTSDSLFFTAVLVSGSLCSMQNRTDNLHDCLEHIQMAYFNSDMFWFGSPYLSLCKDGFADGLPCSNVRPSMNDSIGSRIFSDMMYAPRLDRYLKLTYESTDSKKLKYKLQSKTPFLLLIY